MANNQTPRTNQQPIPEYPAVPTPEELKSNSKKYMILGGILVGVLLVAALVFVLWPEAPPEIAPVVEEVVVPEELPVEVVVPSLELYEFKICSELIETTCTAEKTVFDTPIVAISYNMRGYSVEKAGSENEVFQSSFFPLDPEESAVLLHKEIAFFDAEGNEISYEDPGFYPGIEMPFRFTTTPPDYLFSGETFNFSDFPAGEYYVEIAVTDMFTNEKIAKRLKFTLVPSLEIYDFNVCSKIDQNFNCTEQKDTFTQDETFFIAYKIEGFVSRQAEKGYGAYITKSIQLLDEFGNPVDYPTEYLMKNLTILVIFENITHSMNSGESFEAKYFSPGTYLAELTIRDEFAQATISDTVRFTIQ